MKRITVLLAATALVGAAPPKAPPPVANYWMDVATASGMGAGMMGAMGSGGRPNMAQMMSMMNGGGGAQHMLSLTLASRNKAASPEAEHLIPPGMQMGPSLPLVAPQAAKPERSDYSMPEHFQRPKGRMLIYWGCGEHAGAGQPTIVDFSKLAAGQMPPGFSAMMSAVHAAQPPTSAPGFGEWPNQRDSRPVPATASLLGAHKVEGNYSPPIAFSLSPGQDFMPALGLREAGALPSGAVRLLWTPAAQATGYALSMFGSSGNGDMLIWSSANKPSAFPNMDYLSPAQVKPLVASGAVLAPTTSQCTVPAEVTKASPTGMVMMIGYGPEAWFQDKPKAPTWTVRARYKTTASLMLGMGDMYGDAADQPQQQPEQPRNKKRGFGLGDLLGAVPH
jgi:hypothetical protein